MEKRLDEMKEGEKGRIKSIEGSSIKRRLMDMGIIRNSKIEVIRKAPLGDPIEFSIRGYNLTLRKNEAKDIIVEVEND